ncbi:mannosyl-glycoprotein endo-beta-N-acetylglucosamidase [Thiobacillus denitrificans ATCC 25259]|uniref:Peptidoglycan hydrolase FlgJ n=1 Tax=Thiobacillus denitrificans (strain ATCC 25259 / T1) TaxID=292415 RepID=Q3SIE6_THIDA|nr:flagellar assembly peptidoglycan hydrolase FlgJ [Thiobacillus denitrificans]AAZ97582.1 mannosyl-glycoprotein endo-beta-N-acetylglucosamidase [Thiobacillus denitrificans ATCC 25259]
MSIGGADLSSKFALDVQGVNQLKLDARQSSPEALKAAARQFEAVFMNMLMKSMREATPQDGMFDSEQTRMYTSMLDQQLTQNLASRGIGLADVMVRQLSTALAAQAPGPAGGLSEPGPALAPVPAPAPPQQAPGLTRGGDAPAHVQAFVQRLAPHAEAASASSGIPARFMLGQAALETGWGRSEIRGADGRNSHNLFGIKAGPGWTGRSVDVVTTEYVDGRPQKQVERFRAYDSYADSFRDYARLLRNNARYADVVASGHDAAGFAHGLQQAGYATDPAYASKLVGVIRMLDTA